MRNELPYYFEVPEMPEIPFDVSQYYIPEEDRLEAQQDNKNLDDIQGIKNRSQSANWYQSYMNVEENSSCLLYTSPSPRDRQKSRMPSSA